MPHTVRTVGKLGPLPPRLIRRVLPAVAAIALAAGCTSPAAAPSATPTAAAPTPRPSGLRSGDRPGTVRRTLLEAARPRRAEETSGLDAHEPHALVHQLERRLTCAARFL